jgi:hypothetical protein
MLMALGADPKRCGYKNEQIKSVLKELSRTHLRQDAASAEHLAYMLSQKGLIPPKSGNALEMKAHPEVMQVMIDKDKSPLDEIPADIRAGLLQIYLEHAESVVERQGKAWIAKKLDPIKITVSP